MKKLLLTLSLLSISLFSLANQGTPLSKEDAIEELQQIMMTSEVNSGSLVELKYYVENGNVNFDDYIYIAQLLQEYPVYTASLLESARQISFSRRDTPVYKELIELPFLDLASKYSADIKKLLVDALRCRNAEDDAKLQLQIDALIAKCHYKSMDEFKLAQK
ncbi:hypothetical protein [Flammeovirga kamogawensis]|uniref:TerB family tellurite resistance protein n=1 Tax=Flammeovirga kamogawensis TaxID=373891 RepID=A0ABX8GVW8_9BACT|nr:hypothetical protein [Flammeovirga kamogawensis]MBB6460987.1 hypothetical protein [Flammeovirga kamogawensis]QWG07559.1 hypothetical protein KM029_01075 [Flammeovirga kamogawensis]TRX69371.1 hypothetical protein EO216_15015 [Flammeovirga kamogawensis]